MFVALRAGVVEQRDLDRLGPVFTDMNQGAG
jgi:hypothetical protein